MGDRDYTPDINRLMFDLARRNVPMPPVNALTAWTDPAVSEATFGGRFAPAEAARQSQLVVPYPRDLDGTTRADFLRGEHDLRPAAQTEHRGDLLPLVQSGYTGRTEMDTPAFLQSTQSAGSQGMPIRSAHQDIAQRNQNDWRRAQSAIDVIGDGSGQAPLQTSTLSPQQNALTRSANDATENSLFGPNGPSTLAHSLGEAVTFPGRAIRGEVPFVEFDPVSGQYRPSEKAIGESTNLAGWLMMGGGAAVKPEGSAGIFGGNMPKGYSAKNVGGGINGNTNFEVYKNGPLGGLFGNKRVGNAYVRDLGENAQVGRIAIDPEHTGRGIGTSLYGQIESEMGKALIPDGVLSDAAYNFWQKHRPEAVENYVKEPGFNSWHPAKTTEEMIDRKWAADANNFGDGKPLNISLNDQLRAIDKLLAEKPTAFSNSSREGGFLGWLSRTFGGDAKPIPKPEPDSMAFGPRRDIDAYLKYADMMQSDGMRKTLAERGREPLPLMPFSEFEKDIPNQQYWRGLPRIDRPLPDVNVASQTRTIKELTDQLDALSNKIGAPTSADEAMKDWAKGKRASSNDKPWSNTLGERYAGQPANDSYTSPFRPDEKLYSSSSREGGAGVIAASSGRELDHLGYYSQALESAKGLKQAKGSGDQFLGMLKNSGVKQGEIDATGLGKFLADSPSVTRDDIVSYLRENRVSPREVNYGQLDSFDGNRRIPGDEMFGGSKWSSYSLDSSNPTYRESVVHLPSNSKLSASEDAMDALRGLGAAQNRQPHVSANPDFTNGHFPEPNVIAHLRTSMVKDANGRNVFHLDELQSDWGQHLRDGGVRDEAKVEELKKRMDAAKVPEQIKQDAEKIALNSGYAEWRDNILTPGAHPDWDMRYLSYLRNGLDHALNGHTGGIVSNYRVGPKDKIAEIRSNLDTAMNEYALRQAEYSQAASNSPGHPLVNTSDQWQNTALRRAIRQAVDANADAIGIPSGQTVLNAKMGGEPDGIRYAYDQMYPKNLRNILQRYDKSAKGEQVNQLMLPSGAPAKNSAGHTVFNLTDEFKRRIREEGMQLFSNGAPLPLPSNDRDEQVRRIIMRLTASQ